MLGDRCDHTQSEKLVEDEVYVADLSEKTCDNAVLNIGVEFIRKRGAGRAPSQPICKEALGIDVRSPWRGHKRQKNRLLDRHDRRGCVNHEPAYGIQEEPSDTMS